MSILRELLTHYLSTTDATNTEPDEELADSIYRLLWQLENHEVVIDGWSYFRVVEESSTELTAVGLMWQLPSGSVPIEVNLALKGKEIAWSIRFGQPDQSWLDLSNSKRWNYVYLYADDSGPPEWIWSEPYEGVLRNGA